MQPSENRQQKADRKLEGERKKHLNFERLHTSPGEAQISIQCKKIKN